MVMMVMMMMISFTQLGILQAKIITILARCAHWRHDAMDIMEVTNDFLVGFRA